MTASDAAVVVITRPVPVPAAVRLVTASELLPATATVMTSVFRTVKPVPIRVMVWPPVGITTPARIAAPPADGERQ